MRACDRCGHPNADHLNYCCGCGRRLRERSEAGDEPQARAAPLTEGAGHPSSADGTAPTAFALTVPVPSSGDLGSGGTPDATEIGASPAGWSARMWDAIQYVFVYIRGRIDAEGRKRDLTLEREGAQHQLEGVLFGLGQTVAAVTPSAPAVASLIEALVQARARRDAAIGDLESAERMQAADDLRLGIEQSRAETEWRGCEAAAAALDQSLRALDEQRRQAAHADEPAARADVVLATSTADPATGGGTVPDRHGRQEASPGRARAQLEDQYRSLRERAAAVRASTIAARAKLDLATSARRQATAALTASLSAHARDRAEADRDMRALTVRVGRAAARARLPGPQLAAGYAQITRLEASIAARDHQLQSLQHAIGGYDGRKLAVGGGILATGAAALGTALWWLLH